MSLPDEYGIVRYNTRNGGRGSATAANAWAQIYQPGAINDNNAVRPSNPAGLSVVVGPTNTANPIQVVATTPTGFKIGLEIVDTKTLTVAKPLSNPRVAAIVAYTNDLALTTSQTEVTGSPESCGIVVAYGTEASNPASPTDSQIRAAITSDGGTGVTAAYAVIGYLNVSPSTTAITSSLIWFKQLSGNVTESITFVSGFGKLSGWVVKNAGLVTMNLVIGKTDGGTFPTSQTSVFSIPGALSPAGGFLNSYCAMAVDEWSAPTGLGYLYMGSSGALITASASNQKVAKVSLSYATRI